MKIKINDVLECINKTLDKEREIKGLPKMLGHFAFHIGFEKAIGHIKIFHAQVDFVSLKHDKVAPVIVVHHTMPCPAEELEKAKEQVSLITLKNFFEALRFGKGKGDYENFVNGDFQGWT